MLREAIAVAERPRGATRGWGCSSTIPWRGWRRERFGKGAESVVGDVDGAERETREGSLGEGLDPVVVQLEALEDGEAGDGVGEDGDVVVGGDERDELARLPPRGGGGGGVEADGLWWGRAGAAAAPASPSVNASGGIAPRLRPRRSRTPLERAASSALSIALALIGAIAARFEGARPGEDAR